MGRTRFIFLVFIICAVFITGCVGNDEAATESPAESSSEASSYDYADEVLAEEGAALTDEELDSLEEDLAELEAMLEDLENGTDLTVEDF